jgi:hypothetical protein
MSFARVLDRRYFVVRIAVIKGQASEGDLVVKTADSREKDDKNE